MADTLITQVKKEDQNKQKSRGFFSYIFCCLSAKETNNEGSVSYRRPGRQPTSQNESFLLPPLASFLANRKTLVLDLDETLVHSSFKPIPNADFVIPVEIEDQVHQVYVLKRPGVDQFMKKMGEHYEIVVFTASLAKYADPVLDLLDKHKVVHARLFREACSNHKGNYVKDLGRLGRELKKTIIIDNSPASYMFNPENAIPIESWFDDENDTELLDLVPLLEDLTKVDDVAVALANLQR